MLTHSIPRPSWSFRTLGVVLAVGAVAVLGAAGPPYQAAPPSTSPQSPRTLTLNGFEFDPLVAPPDLPTALRSAKVPPEIATYYVIQLDGPVSIDIKAALVGTGVEVLHYVAHNGFIVRANARMIERARALRFVRWSGPFEPAYKLSPRLSKDFDAVVNRSLEEAWRAHPKSSAVAPTVDSTAFLPVQLLPMEVSRVAAVERRVRALGGSGVQSSSEGAGIVRAEFPREALERLAGEPDVLWIDRELPAFAYNDVARWVIQSNDAVGFATPIHARGIKGTNQRITVADTGIDYEHDAFEQVDKKDATVPPGTLHRKVFNYYVPVGASGDARDNLDNHGTHVAGTVAGDAGVWHAYDGDPTGASGAAGPHDGQAFDAKIEVQDITNQDNGYVYPPIDLNNLYNPSYSHAVKIHTNSWGSSATASYTTQDQQTDAFMWTKGDFLVLFAAGNTPLFGPNSWSVNLYGVAKNVLTVGASGNGVNANDLAQSGGVYFSNRGPAGDGRIKPDLMAPGEAIWSAHGTDPNPPLDDYVQYSGTSMATPAVAGAAALVRQYYADGWYPTGAPVYAHRMSTPSAALLKATLINGAVEMTGAHAYDFFEARYPNNNQGWGRILLDNSLYFPGDARRVLVHDNVAGVATREQTTYRVIVQDPSVPLKVTLVWTDYPGSPLTTPNLVNDLDLVVTSPDGTLYVGNDLVGHNPAQSRPSGVIKDSLNNVESVIIPSGAQQGIWQVGVQGWNVPMGKTNGRQPFAIVISGGLAGTPDGVCDGAADEGFPDTDFDGTADCMDLDDDGDGDPDTTDCRPLIPTAFHGAVESPTGLYRSCTDGIDNDCDGLVDLDCAIDMRTSGGQAIAPGQVVSGSVTDLRAASSQSPTTYEVLRETTSGGQQRLTGVWTFDTSAGMTDYSVVVEGFHDQTGDNLAFSYTTRASTAACTANELSWTPLGLVVTDFLDTDTLIRARVGPLAQGVLCVRADDSLTTGDSTANQFTLDRLYLFPTPDCPDVDGDAYPSTCTNCRPAWPCPLIDCDDHDAAANPGLPEGPPGDPTCYDHRDNNCTYWKDAYDDFEACYQGFPDVNASSDHETKSGAIVTPGFNPFLKTQVSDDVREVLSAGPTGSPTSLDHTWRFDNVRPGSVQRLVVDGRRPQNSESENFQFWYAIGGPDGLPGAWQLIPNALIRSALEPSEPAIYPFGPGNLTGRVYIRIKDTRPSVSTIEDTVEVDYLAIRTTP